MDKLLTQQDLAKRWQVSVATIKNYREDKIIQPVRHLLPTIRFEINYIRELEGVKLEKVSPLQFKRLERELEDTKKENEKLKGIISNVLAETSQILNQGGSSK